MKKQTKAIMRLISLITLMIFIGNINTAAVQAATIESNPPLTTKAEKQATKPRQFIYVDQTIFCGRNFGTGYDYVVTYYDRAFTLGASAEGQLSYQSSDTNVAVVSDDGTVTTTGVGLAYIMIQAAETDQYASNVRIVGVYVNKDSSFISTPGLYIDKIYGSKPFSLKAKAKTPLSYKTSNSKVATVNSEGLVTIKDLGTAKITVKAAETDNYESDTWTVNLCVDLKKPKLKVKRVGKSAVKLSWSKVPGASGYKVMGTIFSDMKRDKKNKDVIRFNYKNTAKKKSAKKRTAIHRNLKRGRMYEYVVRPYRKVGKKIVYGPYSNDKYVNIK